jgi:hypothetical protein
MDLAGMALAQPRAPSNRHLIWWQALVAGIIFLAKWFCMWCIYKGGARGNKLYGESQEGSYNARNG